MNQLLFYVVKYYTQLYIYSSVRLVGAKNVLPKKKNDYVLNTVC